MRLFLHDPVKKLMLVSRDRVRELRDEAAARDFLQPLMDDDRNREALQELATSGDIGLPIEDTDELARRLVRGGLVVVDFADERVEEVRLEAAATTTPLEDEEAAAEPEEPEEEHWIELELVDDEGNPRAGERYFIELPDGSTKSGRLNSEGRARVEGVDPGTARISFPDLDRELYESK